MTPQPTDKQLARQLAQLLPVPATLDTADLMYRAGYAAGQASSPSRSIIHRGRWLSMAAMIMLTGLTGYQLGQRSLPLTVATPTVAPSPAPIPTRPSDSLAVATTQATPDSNADAASVGAVGAVESDLQPVHSYIWEGLFFNRSEQAARLTAFPMIGNELDPEQLLEKLSLVSTMTSSVRRDGDASSADDQPRRLMTARDTAAWMSSY